MSDGQAKLWHTSLQDALDRAEQAEAEVERLKRGAPGELSRAWAEVAVRDRMLRLVKSLLPLPADGTPLDDWLADLRTRAEEGRE